MAYKQIPIDVGVDAEPFEQVLTLDGLPYVFRYRWAERAAAWSLDVFDGADTALVAGVPLLIGADLLRQHNDPRLPAGSLVVVDTSSSGAEAGMLELGGRVQLYYAEAADVAAIAAAAAA